jgi:hypothetical protein
MADQDREDSRQCLIGKTAQQKTGLGRFFIGPVPPRPRSIGLALFDPSRQYRQHFGYLEGL